MTALEALNNLKNRALQDCDFKPWTLPEANILAARERMNEKTQEEYAILEKELKALEIIKKKNLIEFNVNRVQENYYLTTGNDFSGRVALTEEEYDLLKEVLE